MSLIQWDAERFSVCDSRMDEQHQNWIELINTLHDSLMRKGGHVSAEEAIRGVLDYTTYHFKEEEELMRAVDFPGYAAHKQLHDEFAARVMGIEQQIREGDLVLRSQVMSLLVNWFEDHILTQDKRYAGFLAESHSQPSKLASGSSQWP